MKQPIRVVISMPRQYHWLILSREYSYSRTTILKRTVSPHFSAVIAQLSPSVCPIALETIVSSSVPNSRLFSIAGSMFRFRNSSARQCYHLTFPQIVAIILLFSRLLSIVQCSSSNPSSFANTCNQLLRYGYKRHRKST